MPDSFLDRAQSVLTTQQQGQDPTAQRSSTPPSDFVKQAQTTLSEIESPSRRTARIEANEFTRSAREGLLDAGYEAARGSFSFDPKAGLAVETPQPGGTGTISFSARGVQVKPSPPIQPGLGLPQVPINRNVSLRNTIRDYTEGILDLPFDSINPANQSRLAYAEYQKLTSAFPTALATLEDAERATGKELIRPIGDLVVTMNHAPASPREERRLTSNTWNDYIGAVGQNRIALNFSDQRKQAMSQLTPDLIQQVASKVNDFTPINEAVDLLDEEGPFGNEVEAFTTMGKPFFQWKRDHRKYFTARDRWEKLLGRQLPGPEKNTRDILGKFPPTEGETPGAATGNILRPPGEERPPEPRQEEETPVPVESIWDARSLGPLFPQLQQLLTDDNEQQQRRQQATAARDEELTRTSPFLGSLQRIELQGREAGGLPRLLENTLAWTGHAIDVALLGLPGAAISAIPEVGANFMDVLAPAFSGSLTDTVHTAKDFEAGFAQFKADTIRSIIAGTPEAAAADQKYAYALQQYSDLPVQDRALIASSLFSARDRVEARFRDVQKFAELEGFLNRGVAFGLEALRMQEPAAVQAVGSLGALVDDPSFLALAAAGGVGISRRSIGKRRRVRRDVATRKRLKETGSPFQDLDTAGFQRLSDQLKAEQVRGAIDYVRDSADTPFEAKALLERMVDELNESGIGMTPEMQGTVRAAWDTVSQVKERAKFMKLGPEHSEALISVRQAAAPESFFNSAYVKDPGGAFIVDAAAPANLARSARNWTQAVDAATAAIPEVPTVLEKGPSGVRLANLGRAVITENARIQEAGARAVRMRDILRDVENEVRHESQAQAQALFAIREQRTAANLSHNQNLIEAFHQANGIERLGGDIVRANPELRKPFFNQTEAMLQPTTASRGRLRSWAFTPKGNLNRRGLEKIGGKEWAASIDRLHRTVGGDARPILEREILEQVHDQLGIWRRSILEPLLERRPANPRPRIGHLDNIAKKIFDATSNKPIQLTNAELAFVNEFRPGAPLRPTLGPAQTALEKTEATLNQRVGRLSKLQEEVAEGLTDLEFTTPDKVIEFRPSATLLSRVENYLDDTTRGLIDTKRKYASISEPDRALKTQLQAWRELREGVADETRDLERGLFDELSFHLETQPLPHKQQFLQDVVRAQKGMVGEVSLKAARLLDQMERMVPDSERALILESIESGKIHPKLPQDSATYIINEMHRQRGEALARSVDSGRLSPEKFHEFMRQDYYHESYFTNPDVLEKVRAVAALDKTASQTNWAPLRVDAREFKFRRPEDSFWIAYRAGGDIRRKKGFATRDAATEWVDGEMKAGRLDPATEVSVFDPVPKAEKILEGLKLDPALSHGQLMKQMVLDEAAYRYQKALSRSGLVFSADRIKAEGGQVGLKRTNTIEFDGEVYQLIPNSSADFANASHLKGKYAPVWAVREFQKIEQGFDYYKSIVEAQAKAMENAPTDWLSKGAEGLAKGFRAVQPRLFNLFGVKAVALNFTLGSHIKGWFGNLAYARWSGFDIMNPVNALKFTGLLRETVKELAGDAEVLKRAARTLDADELLKSSRISAETQELIRGGLINVDASFLDRGIARATEKFWEGKQGMQNRLTTLERELEKHSDNPDLSVRLSAARDKLLSEINQEMPKTLGGIFGALSDLSKRATKRLWDESGGKGDWIRKAWSSYVMGSGDTLMKIITHKHLRRELGMTEAEALSEIRSFFQQLHDPPEIVKKFGRKFGGAMFLGYRVEQARILTNAVKRRKRELAMDLTRIGAWNGAMIASRGEGLNEFLEGSALTKGLQRSSITDLQALVGNIQLPIKGAGGAHYAIPVEPYFGVGAFFDAQGPMGNSIKRLFKQSAEPGNSYANFAGDVVGGLTESFVGAEPTIQLFTMLATGRQPNNDPIETPSDYVAGVGKIFMPRLLPGSQDWPRVKNVLQGNERDPRTFHDTKFPEWLGGVMVGMRRRASTPDKIRYAMSRVSQLRHDPVQIRSQERFEAQLHRQIATRAMKVDPATGELVVDPALQEQIVRDYIADTSNRGLEPSGAQPDLEVKTRRTEDLLEKTAIPRILSSLKRMPLDELVHIYAIYRRADTNPDPNWDRSFLRIVDDKIKSRRANREQLNLMRDRIQNWLKDPAVPKEAREELDRWERLTSQTILEIEFNKFNR